MNGYDIQSVGEDMELILKLQEILYDLKKYKLCMNQILFV